MELFIIGISKRRKGRMGVGGWWNKTTHTLKYLDKFFLVLHATLTTGLALATPTSTKPWKNWDITILFEDLKTVHYPTPTPAHKIILGEGWNSHVLVLFSLLDLIMRGAFSKNQYCVFKSLFLFSWGIWFASEIIHLIQIPPVVYFFSD